MKSSVYIVVCIIFPIHSMDNPLALAHSEQYKEECKRSLVSHIVSMSGGKVDVANDLLKRKIALERTVNVQSCCSGSAGQKHCNKHSGNDILLLSDRTGYVEIFYDNVEINRNGKSKILRMPHADLPSYARKEDDYIRACALNADGSTVAAVGGSFLCIWRIWENASWLHWNQDISELIQKVVLVNHVALSDSGGRVAINVVFEKSKDSRILVMDRVCRKLLCTLKGNSDYFFYLLGENILANRLDKHCYQYDLDIADEPWRMLKEEQKSFLYDIYQRYEETKQRVCLKQGSGWLTTYQTLPQNVHIKTWLDERVYVEGKGWVAAMLGY